MLGGDNMAVKFPKYKLTKSQIDSLARIILEENNSSDAARYAEASIIANLSELKYGSARAEDLKKIICSGWFAKGKQRWEEGLNGGHFSDKEKEKARKCVNDVFVLGKRFLPKYVNEHDCMGDISTVLNGVKAKKSQWVPHKTIIYNRYSSKYYFYSFPGGASTGVDPFGYTSQIARLKYGEFHYTLQQCMDDSFIGQKIGYQDSFPVLPDSSFGVDRKYYQKGDGDNTLRNYREQIRRIQKLLNWVLDINLTIDGIYGQKVSDAVTRLQKKAKTEQNGKFGNICLEYCKSVKK